MFPAPIVPKVVDAMMMIMASVKMLDVARVRMCPKDMMMFMMMFMAPGEAMMGMSATDVLMRMPHSEMMMDVSPR